MDDTRYKVLLIEDDEIDQMAFERLVKGENLSYDYTIAASISDANRILAANKFDVAILDYRLGDGTAFDILDSITDTPTIFTTRAGNEELAVKAMKAGSYDYLIKDPTRNYLKVLPEIINHTINYKRTQDELKKYHDNLETLVKERTEQLEERTEQLAEEKELLSVTFSSMSDGVLVVNVEKQVILFNKVAENLTGWNFKEVQGKPIGEVLAIINERTKEAVENPVDKVLQSGKIETGSNEDCIVAKDGSERAIAACAASIQKDDETIVGIVMVIRDVAREREVDRMKADFVSSVSHELRTPLTSIKAFIQTILHEPEMPKETEREFLGIVKDESDRLASLIENLLEASRIEPGTTKIVRELVDIPAVTRQVLSALEPLAEEKNIQLQSNVEAELPELQGDESKIQSAITNLLNNAIKFTPQHGKVSLSITHKDDKLIIRISDTGMGIPKDALGKIFDRFYRVYRPGKQIQGTGLGLAIVKKIVEMHGGRIEVESEVDRGTTFTIVLPLTTQPILEAEVVKQR